ncbi:pilin [Psychrobacter sp. AOP7-B1-24]|uniref:pilin n=1 Tax=Psychrobacter sp. AOP7-B1-24 TaxID=3457645 RepID=UPI00402BA78E
MKPTTQTGFTLIEIMIVIAIIGILTSIALPHYNSYTSRTRAAAAAVELASIKQAVNECVAQTGIIAGCDAGTSGIPAIAAFTTTSNVTALIAVSDGVISAIIGSTDNTGNNLTYINTPTMVGGGTNMVWTNTGTVCNAARGFRSGAGNCP